MRHDIELEAFRLTAMLLSVEQWANRYKMAEEQHGELIKATSKWQLVLTRFFKDMGNSADKFINRQHYEFQLAKHKANLDRQTLDFNVEVIVNDDQIDDYDGNFIKVSLQPMQNMVYTGASAAADIYNLPLTEHASAPRFQKSALNQTAALVGKKVVRNPDGSLKAIIDNPNAAYNVLDTVRADIAASVEHSLAAGLSTDEAIEMLRGIISDPSRAELIANTESVRAYNSGTMEFADSSDAVGKEWETAGADDECADNEAQGPIAVDDDFVSGDDQPPAHPNCRCAVRLIYKEEWQREGYGDNAE